MFEILGAGGSLLAVVVAVVLATRERADRKAAERDRDEARDAEKRRREEGERRRKEENVRRVAVWIDKGPLGSPGEFIYCKNFTDLPILDVQFVHWDADGVSQTIVRLPKILPTGMGKHVAPPNTEALGARFRDGFGHVWKMKTDGSLSEITAASDRS